VTLSHPLSNKTALDVEGIFRVSGSHASVQEIRKNFSEKNGNTDVDLTPFGPHVVSSTVMQWLCELENPLITFDCYSPLIIALGFFLFFFLKHISHFV